MGRVTVESAVREPAPPPYVLATRVCASRRIAETWCSTVFVETGSRRAIVESRGPSANSSRMSGT
jgi:hypothetical protein